MARVYGDAATLPCLPSPPPAAASASSPTIPSPPPNRPLSHSTSTPPDDPAYHVLAQREDPNEECLRSLTNSAPLSFRGWTLQESALSLRTLFYGARQLYWERPNPTLLEEYYHLVAECSSRALTYPSDKFPALSGLVRRLQPALRTEYLASLWLSDIRRGLLWFPEVGFAPHVVPARAPSWAWAATDTRALFDFGVFGGEDEDDEVGEERAAGVFGGGGWEDVV
ncbi:hypothetical protein B0T18DRAFT_427185 [Schizothecium vesticola]|uniref:Uncharacterized protein n=1 Tax=Schizothecium vesticola TaxID=314040 RepID=A0AA40F0F9_9PEZI|nr:hypothetical protein B0T18DRAFT_427185 [Schizothecium vesticola]